MLRQIYQSYANVAVRYGLPFQLGTLTWQPRNRLAQHRSLGERASNLSLARWLFLRGEKFLKNVTNFRLAIDSSSTAYCVSAGRPRYYLLLTGIHRLLAPLFTIIPIY